MKIYAGIYQNNVELNIRKENYNKQIKQTPETAYQTLTLYASTYIHLSFIDLEDNQ